VNEEESDAAWEEAQARLDAALRKYGVDLAGIGEQFAAALRDKNESERQMAKALFHSEWAQGRVSDEGLALAYRKIDEEHDRIARTLPAGSAPAPE
jgi:hypothetical protein